MLQVRVDDSIGVKVQPGQLLQAGQERQVALAIRLADLEVFEVGHSLEVLQPLARQFRGLDFQLAKLGELCEEPSTGVGQGHVAKMEKAELLKRCQMLQAVGLQSSIRLKTEPFEVRHL